MLNLKLLYATSARLGGSGLAALASAIERLYRDRDLGATLGAAGRRRVVEYFTWEYFGTRLLEAWRVAQTLRPR